MNSGRTVFSQLIEFLPHQEFQKCVARYGGGRYLKNLSCWDQYLAMAFAQLTYRESLRDIEACLRSIGGKLYHMIASCVSGCCSSMSEISFKFGQKRCPA